MKFGNGGNDAKQFIHELADIYINYAQSKNIRYEELLISEGHVLLKLIGNNVWDAFKNESGRHVVQRYSKLEKNGKVHTSSVFVIILPLLKNNYTLDMKDIDIKTQCGHGPGGQHQNKTASAVRAIHRPTGLHVFINGRDQIQNKKNALNILASRVSELKNKELSNKQMSLRYSQIKDGSKSEEKTRTYNFVIPIIIDHKTGEKTNNIKDILKGNLNFLK